ncbi:MAG: cupin domain-containing protein [Thermodesulfobacteriota bacterium]
MPFYKWDELEGDVITPSYSKGKGPSIRGETIEVSLISYPAGTVARPHAHPNEQFQVVVKGKARYRVGGEEKVLGPGEVVLMPANTEHDIKIFEDLEVINVKNVIPGWSVKHATWEM